MWYYFKEFRNPHRLLSSVRVKMPLKQQFMVHFNEISWQLSQLPSHLKQRVTVVYSNHLLGRAQQVFILSIMIIPVPGVVSVIYSFLIHLHTVMWEACICGIPTSVVTSGFPPHVRGTMFDSQLLWIKGMESRAFLSPALIYLSPANQKETQ